jgi:type II secretory pathway predicted ATPase ExeA
MYENFFGLTERPFSLVPDPDFFYLSPQHKLASAYLEYGITQKLCFVLLTGEIGTGKTTLIRSFLKTKERKLRLGVLYQTAFSPEDLLEFLLKEFNIRGHFHSRATRLAAFNDFLFKAYSRGEHVVLVLDEAHNMEPAALEEVRLLSNVQADKEPLLQVILVGQPDLLDRLRQPALRQLAQRVGVHFHLQPLDKEETREYIQFRLARAGGSGIFTPSALDKIFEYTQGVPRRINVWCDLALVAAFVEDRQEIDREFIETVVAAQGGTLEGPEDLESASDETLYAAPGRDPGPRVDQLTQPSGSPGDVAGEGFRESSGNHLRREVQALSARVSRMEGLVLDLTNQLVLPLYKLISQPPPDSPNVAAPPPIPLPPGQGPESKSEESPLLPLEIPLEEGQTDLPEEQLPPARRSFRKIIGAVIGAVMVAGLAALVIYTNLPGKISLKESETPGTSTKTSLNSPQEQSPLLQPSPTPQIPQEQADSEEARRIAAPQPEPLTPQKQPASGKVTDAGALPSAPGSNLAHLEAPTPSLQPSQTPQIPQEQADSEEARRIAAPQPEPLTPQKQPASEKPTGTGALPVLQQDIQSEGAEWSPLISYQVTAKDTSLIKIIASHYPNSKQAGFTAVILSNPQITKEDLIFAKQTLLLPGLNKNNNIIKLNDNLYYIFYDYFNIISKLNKTTSMLKSLGIKFIVRETQDSLARKVYRIYLGGYENEADLKEALKKTEGK